MCNQILHGNRLPFYSFHRFNNIGRAAVARSQDGNFLRHGGRRNAAPVADHPGHVDDGLLFKFAADENLHRHGADVQADGLFDVHGGQFDTGGRQFMTVSKPEDASE